MWKRVWPFLFLFPVLASQVFAREPIPFTNPGADGFVFVLWTDYTDDAINAFLARIKQTGAHSLTVPLFGCQSTITSSDVGSCDLMAERFRGNGVMDLLAGSRDKAEHIAQLAIQAGFQTTFLPIVATPQWDWRGTFAPTDVAGWFKSYETWIKGVAADANSLGMKELIVGSEFSILYQYSAQWTQLLSDMHQVFTGPLIVTVNWGQLDGGFWDQADAIGVSEYYPLSTSNSPTQNDLNKGAEAVKSTILAAGKKYKRPIYLTEVGFPSTVAAAKVPWTALSTDAIDYSLQAECFQAFSNAWSGETALARMAVWATGDDSGPDYDYSYEILGKPAEDVMKNFFAARSKI
jgi:hypothetical protein